MVTLRLTQDMSETWDVRDGLEWLEQRERLSRELQLIDAGAEKHVHVKLEGEGQNG